MRTIKQIEAKIKSLKVKLQKQEVCENFGQKEIRQLNDWIMGTNSESFVYYYHTAQVIFGLVSQFQDWCETHTGSEKI